MKPCERVAGLLLARRWALAVLSGSQPSVAPDLPRSVWQRFLVLERCAAVLLDRVSDPGAIPAETLEVLRAAAAGESQSSLRARAEGHELSEIASRLDFPIVVLKGGVRAIAGLPPTLPLTDIDILVEQSQVATVTSLLRDAGFGEPVIATRHHQGLNPASDRLAIEVHWTTNDDGTAIDREVWNRSRPIPGTRALHQLGAADNLEHVLRHAVSSHRDRSVALRDMILAGACAVECSAADLSSVRSSISMGRHAVILQSMLDMSIELAAPRGSYPADPFERETATFYAATVAELDSARQLASPSAVAFVTEIALGRTSYREAPSRAYTFRGSGNETLARFAKRHPHLVKPVICAAHAGYYAVASALLLPRIRQIVTQAFKRIGPQTH